MTLFSLPLLPLFGAAENSMWGSSGPIVTFLAVMGGLGVISFIAEYIAHTFGRSEQQNLRFSIAAFTIAILYVFWNVWSQQVNFADQSINPENGSFRLILWMFLLISLIVPFVLCYNALFSVYVERWMPGFVLFFVRILVVIALWIGYVSMTRNILSLLKDVRLSLFR